MKRIISFLPAIVISVACFVVACGENKKDSVEQAKDQNMAKDTMNSNTMPNDTTHTGMAVDKEASDFAVDAANGGMTEVAASQIAQKKAMDAKVKDFANMMVKDHMKVNDELKAIAASKNITLPAMIGADMQKNIDDLNAKSGKDFDKAYMDMMVKDHEKTLTLLKKGAGLKDAGLAAFANKTIPAVEMHLNTAKAITGKN